MFNNHNKYIITTCFLSIYKLINKNYKTMKEVFIHLIYDIDIMKNNSIIFENIIDVSTSVMEGANDVVKTIGPDKTSGHRCNAFEQQFTAIPDTDGPTLA